MSGATELDRRQGSEQLVQLFKALGHPLRLHMMRRMMFVPELACTELEETLPIGKPTISYHIKLLHRAGLITVKRVGKYFYYSAREEQMERMLPGLPELLRRTE